MDHFHFDSAKYQQHIARARKNAIRVGQLLEAIGSLARATRAVREAVHEGHAPADTLDSQEALLQLIAEQMAPDTLARPEPPAEVDDGLLDELVALMLETILLMRFSNFIISPGCQPQG